MKKRVLAMVLVGVLTLGCMAGCGKKGESEGGNSAADVEISYWHAGLGEEWLEVLVKAFNEKHPEYNVYYKGTADLKASHAAFGLEDVDTIDLYFSGKQYDAKYMEPLNDILDTIIEGESKSIKEKFDAAYLEQEELDGKYYQLTYGGGILGFVYSKALFQEAGIKQLPRTTDELAVVCATLSDNDIMPLCHFKPSGYYWWLSDVWFAQYSGMEYFYDFYTNPSKEKMITEDGRYEVLQAMEKIIKPEYTLQGSNSEEHVTMQTKFLEGSCAMMLNGSWLASEMSNSDKIGDFEMMKTPVISSITDKLSTVKNEPQLRKLITAIDNVTDGVETIDTYKDGKNYKVDGQSISAADWEYVRVARNMMPANYTGETAYIPTYSNAKEGAKEFLKFMYSDEGYQLYLDTLHVKMPLNLSAGEIDTSKWNAYELNQADLFDKAEYNVSGGIMGRHRLFTDGGAHAFANKEFVNLFCSRSEADRINAKEAWDSIVALINDNYDTNWLLNIK